MLPSLLELRQKCLNTSHFLMSTFRFFGLKIQLSPLSLAWDTSLSRQAAIEKFLPWVLLQKLLQTIHAKLKDHHGPQHWTPQP